MAYTRQVLRIFISSTATDLSGYRDEVSAAVLGLGDLPIAMETFSALGGEPALECMRKAVEADAVVCIVAHRYGYVPPVELGGDGERSITWLEVAAAKRAGKPVSEPEKAAEIFKAVQKLQEFKDYLGRECTLATFTGPEHLAERVVISLANFASTPQ